MKRLWIIAMLVLGINLSAQTDVSFGVGVLEQTRNLGIGLAVNVSVQQELVDNLGVGLIYTKGFMQTGNVILVDSGISLPKDGDDFQQLQLMLNYKIYTSDENLAIRPSIGAARQISGGIFPTFALDIMPFPKDKVHAFLSWSPVIRDGFYEGEGWSHTVTINFGINI